MQIDDNIMQTAIAGYVRGLETRAKGHIAYSKALSESGCTIVECAENIKARMLLLIASELRELSCDIQCAKTTKHYITE